MRIHKEGQLIIMLVLVFLMVLFVIITYLSNCNPLYYTSFSIAAILILSFLMFFFRNPARKVNEDRSVLYSPADGKIVAIEEVDEIEYLKRKCIKVSIFMSVWNVHVNRYPISGRISYTKYHPGKYLVACLPKSSELNERQTVAIESPDGNEIMIKQIAGAIARRVVCYAKVEKHAIQGDDLGFIKFGSRVDLFLPLNTVILVKMNEKVKGNRTIIARLNH